MGVSWTEEQQQVIDVRQKNILVSAAAGSGKTAVLVARILKMITDKQHPVDIDRLLVVTFTNAAAAEMRERIRDALEQRAEEEPDNVHLQRQLVLVHNARITTIHSFCLNVLRNHFQAVELDPAFRIADEGEMTLLEQDGVREILKEAYETADEEFVQFLEQFAPGKNDHTVEETILQLYHFALGQPWPRQWMEQCAAAYEGDWDGTWLDYIVQDTAGILEDLKEQVHEAIRVCQEPGGPYLYIPALESDLQMLDHLMEAQDYHAYARIFEESLSFTALSRKKDDTILEEKKKQVQELRQSMKDQLKALRGKYFYDSEEALQQEYRESGLVVRVLVKLTERFMDYLAALKTEKNLVDFSDLEHFALEILSDASVAAEYAESFEEVMIDEYQDSNLVQELILNRVAGKGCGAHNLFMVGDVKQSIYRFRLARPELFMEKYSSYRESTEEACRIDLHRNFRSRRQVLEGVNHIFRQIMMKKLGGVAYDDDAALYPGAVFEPGINEEELRPELLLLEAESSEKQEKEARAVGLRIQKLVGKMPVWDKERGHYRPAKYSDIVILLRTVSGWADSFGEVLGDMGIPCFTGSQSGYFSAMEIRTVLAYLQILDNPIQDIPLAAVLRSFIGGLKDEQLAKIRIHGGADRNFFECCQLYRESGLDKEIKAQLEAFFSVYDSLRKKSVHTPVHMLLWELLDVTRFGEYVQVLPAGSQRKANLDMLVEKAIAYETTSYRGLYHFVRYIENLKKYEIDYGEANIGSEADDTVRIMSIHKSKGLEFPVVFVCGMGKQFNETDSRSKVVLHPEYGIGCDYVDTTQRFRQANLLKRAIQHKIQTENLGEELRVLYVAMTRAKEKLILTGSVTDLEKKTERWRMAGRHQGKNLSYSAIGQASAYLDWVMPVLLRMDGTDSFPEEMTKVQLPGFELQLLTGEEMDIVKDLTGREERILLEYLEQIPEAVCQDDDTSGYLNRIFAASYPYESDASIIGKMSVSDLKKMSHVPEEEEGQELYREETVIPLIPAFREKTGEITGAARGTVYHYFMENFDFSRADEIELQLEELISCGKMSKEEAQVLDLTDIQRFLCTDLASNMTKAALRGRLFRERPFVLGVPADTIRREWNAQETVLVQGIIDAYFIDENGEITLLDYKTDKVPYGNLLVEKYKAQLDYYGLALERLTGRKIRDCFIYSFHLHKVIPVS